MCIESWKDPSQKQEIPSFRKTHEFTSILNIFYYTLTYTSLPLPLLPISLLLTFQTPNLIAQQHFRAHTLPPPIPSSGDHKPTRRIDMQSADNTGAMARNDEEGNCAASVFDIAEIVEAEDIIRCTG